MKRVVFFGTPFIATPFLKALYSESAFEVVGVVTQPDKPAGRKQVLTASPIATLAEELGILLLKPDSLKNDPEITGQLESLNADFFVVFAYGKIIPESILGIPNNGCINVHPSKLPTLRGPSPIQTAIRNQFSSTAITIMLMDAGMDSGPILQQLEVPLSNTETTESLSETIMKKGPLFLVETLKGYLDGSITATPQNDDLATFCKMIKKEDGQMNPLIDSAADIAAAWRAFAEWPKCKVMLNGEWHTISEVSVYDDVDWLQPGEFGWNGDQLLLRSKSGTVAIESIQPPGKGMMKVNSFVNGLQKPVEWLKSQRKEEGR